VTAMRRHMLVKLVAIVMLGYGVYTVWLMFKYQSVWFLLWAVRARDPYALMAARALFVSYAAILMYGMLNYGLRQRHFWFVVALTVAVPHVYGQWRARARVHARRTRPLYGVVPCVESQA